MLEALRKTVCEANKLLPAYGLVEFTWGNVSAIDRETNLVAIKPSGVPYDSLTPENIVIVDLDGNVVEGRDNPSSDTATHVILYKNFKNIGGIVHTHSVWATSWAQAGEPIPCYGTTHADFAYGEIPCTRVLTEKEINEGYEENTGNVIVNQFKDIDYMAVSGVICQGHGPFAWGSNAIGAVKNAKILEEVAHLAFLTRLLNPAAVPIPQYLLDKHYFRKHGPNAYYGQTK